MQLRQADSSATLAAATAATDFSRVDCGRFCHWPPEGNEFGRRTHQFQKTLGCLSWLFDGATRANERTNNRTARPPLETIVPRCGEIKLSLHQNESISAGVRPMFEMLAGHQSARCRLYRGSHDGPGTGVYDTAAQSCRRPNAGGRRSDAASKSQRWRRSSFREAFRRM